MVHCFHTTVEGRTPRPVLTVKLAKLGIGGFCLRMVCQLSNSFSATTGV
jgi:hypothetical protein